MRKVITADGIFRPDAPLSHAVRIDNLLFVSGITPFDLNGDLGDDFESQMRETMRSLGAILQAGGASFATVAKCTVLLARREDWSAMNRIYAEYWPDGEFPARTAFEAKLPHPKFLLEIECVAECRA